MKLSSFIIQLAVYGQLGSAFSPLITSSRTVSFSRVQRSTSLFSSQWEDEEEDIAIKPTSFEEAGAGLQKEDDDKRMAEMGDFDANPSYNSADIERYRAAIKERASALGIEEAKVTQNALKEAEERAKASLADRGSGGSQMLDLSQITQTKPRGPDDDNIADIFYEPENEMSEEEMKEADPLGQKTLLEQAKAEIAETIWPTPFAALKEVAILVVAIAFTAGLIIGWDNVLRNFYTDIGLIPGPEDLKAGAENMVLPEGWTDGMSEDDFMKFRDEVGKAATAVKDSAFPDL